jgi:hypothetical protein
MGDAGVRRASARELAALAVGCRGVWMTRRKEMRRTTALALGTLMLGSWHPVGLGAQRIVQHISGQNVAPIFDGYEANPDGTYTLWFGYRNRNQEEHLEVPIGPDNRFEPGPADRGQPTHFVPEWQKSVFKVVVPKDFGKQRLTWWLTSHGKTESVVATLNPYSIIDRKKTTIEGTKGENLAPTVTAEPASQAVALTTAATISVSATDDGLPLNPRTQKPEGLSVRWRKYRGPESGQTTFAPPASPVVDGKASTKVMFSEPGQYVVQAVVDDGSLYVGTYCCWINAEVTVTVK